MSDYDEGKINRRTMLKGIGGASAIGMGSAFSVSVAAAHEGEERPIEILRGDKKHQLANEMMRTYEFHALLQKARELGYSYRPGLEYIDAGRVETQDWQREVVAIELTGSDDGVQAGIILGRKLGEDDFTISQFDIEYFDNKGLFQKLERYTRSEQAGAETINPTGETFDKQVIRPGNEIEPEFFHDGLPDLPDQLNVNNCSGCYYASKLICRNVCGAFGGFICGLLGITVVGAVSCVAFVKAVCWVAEKASGCGNDVAATVCKSSGLGVCGPDEDGTIIDAEIPYI